jgi:LysR family glycine cleavage system transcriptional activator
MDWLQLPSLNSLRAFSALAETGRYSKAAASLNVTRAAVRQQVKALEAYLGTSLVIRRGRGTSLTPEGKLLAQELDVGFRTIQAAVEKLKGVDASRPVQITTSPAFAVEWLMPRIMEFQQQHPEITLMLNPTADVIELEPGGIDVAVRYCHREAAHKDVTPLLVSDMVVVGSASLLERSSLKTPRSLIELPWLQELGTNEVADWFKRRAVVLDRPLIISQMPGNLIMQAVRRGNGITYTARAFFEDDIRAGSIKVLHSEPASGVYYIETNHGTLRGSVRKFLAWLQTKAEIATVPLHKLGQTEK